jgi:response regulator RpfG family c-di-GMP phosphodiesterase
MGTPVLLVVDEDRAVLEALVGDLGRRFGVDYQLLAEGSPAAALTTLGQLAAGSQPVALVLAGQQMTQMTGVEFLVAAHQLHPAAKRVLLVGRGDYTAAHPAVQAMTLGQIDYHLFTPWQPAERWLYPPMGDFLAGWSKTHLAEHAASVAVLVRGEDLGTTMSDYLVKQIQATPNISVRLRTEVVDGQGSGRLERLTLHDGRSHTTQTIAAAALFVLIGAEPRTHWLRETVGCDQRGYLLTGRDLLGAEGLPHGLAACAPTAVP